MNTNLIIFNLLKDNALVIVIFIFLIIKIIPPEWSGFNKYTDQINKIRAKRKNALGFIIDGIMDGIISPIFVHVSTMFGFKNTITILIFFVIGFDVFIRQQISGTVVTLIAIGIIALYLEKLIETGKNIKLFGNLMTWERKDN